MVGPSGVGKDTLIDHCRRHLTKDSSFVFPRRSITRDDTAAEDHDVLSEEAFDAQVEGGAFALHWGAHGLRYGIPAGIAADLAAGRTVVVNVSRTVVDDARKRFQPTIVVSLVAPAAVLAERLRKRGRETEADIARRLSREVGRIVDGEDVMSIDTSGSIEDTGATLLSILRG